MGNIKEIGSLVLLTFLMMGIEIAPLLKEQMLYMRRCIVLVVDGKAEVDRILHIFSCMGAHCESKLEKPVINNEAYVFAATTTNQKRLSGYIETEPDLVLIIIICGSAPEFLSGEYAIPIEELNEDEIDVAKLQLERFRKCVRLHPKEVIKCLERFKTSNWYRENSSKPKAEICLCAVLTVYAMFFRETHTEEQTKTIYTLALGSIQSILKKAGRWGEDVDVMQSVRRLIVTYIDKHPDVRIGDVDRVEGDVLKGMETAQTILYDAAWYYIPEQLFRNMCAPMLAYTSILDIKRNLAENGALYCDNGKSFTIKKAVTNVYGYSQRIRVLKIDKEYIVEDGELSLEERRDGSCTLGR